MIELRELQLLTALARHRHFAKAAEECALSQPAFSMRLRALEERLGLTVVRRGNRFQGLTEEGEMILRHARGILDGAKALEQEIAAAKGQVTGMLVLGVVPTATAFAAQLTGRLHEAHPNLLVRIEVTTSITLQQRLFDGTIDAGITYSDSLGKDQVTITSLYDESYVLFAPEAMVSAEAASITWEDAAQLPLSLLEPQMQNRRILDRIFADRGLSPSVMSESSGFMSAMVMARSGAVATILPRALVEALGQMDGTRVLDLQDAAPADPSDSAAVAAMGRPICLASIERQPELTTVRALREIIDASGQICDIDK
ncbi:HTH-type transcriptional activator CmpR [Tritonibacter multivorans]|uniref:HTH-type transcriptional activator CmpR n=1 Tax=Tritonibacter multivorans TaxID=928856 RepID=A0A0P1GR76_9RHOB|nr:LysR family transcriptional regulator [Tritonibacter multivorans]MDA7422360.1 LysR family transcriptional regulator [Tritonibacter multivorans]CUH77690.1 HTH-type transcriptional activator CmpR [Tritonibacter multivorans]SFD14119.1 transcriptional regulator, LysR family [Tritonibacter multivorans]